MRLLLLPLLALITACGAAANSSPGTVTVTSTSTAIPGTLEPTMACARIVPGVQTIAFQDNVATISGSDILSDRLVAIASADPNFGGSHYVRQETTGDTFDAYVKGNSVLIKWTLSAATANYLQGNEVCYLDISGPIGMNQVSQNYGWYSGTFFGGSLVLMTGNYTMLSQTNVQHYVVW